MKLRNLAFLFATVVSFTACESRTSDTDSAKITASGLQDALALATEAAAAVETTNRATETCLPTWGECAVCYEVDSGLSGAITAALAAPCGAETTTQNGTAIEYTVDNVAISGTFSATTSGVDVSLSGTREATVTIGGDRTYDAAFSLDSADATIVDGAIATASIAMSYTGFADGNWSVEATVSNGVITGTVTRPTGASCTVSGTPAAVAITCEGGRRD